MNHKCLIYKYNLILITFSVLVLGKTYYFQNDDTYLGCDDTYASTLHGFTNNSDSSIIRVEN